MRGAGASSRGNSRAIPVLHCNTSVGVCGMDCQTLPLQSCILVITSLMRDCVEGGGGPEVHLESTSACELHHHGDHGVAWEWRPAGGFLPPPPPHEPHPETLLKAVLDAIGRCEGGGPRLGDHEGHGPAAGLIQGPAACRQPEGPSASPPGSCSSCSLAPAQQFPQLGAHQACLPQPCPGGGAATQRVWVAGASGHWRACGGQQGGRWRRRLFCYRPRPEHGGLCSHHL